jgi:hypothetical protein
MGIKGILVLSSSFFNPQGVILVFFLMFGNVLAIKIGLKFIF